MGLVLETQIVSHKNCPYNPSNYEEKIPIWIDHIGSCWRTCNYGLCKNLRNAILCAIDFNFRLWRVRPFQLWRSHWNGRFGNRGLSSYPKVGSSKYLRLPKHLGIPNWLKSNLQREGSQKKNAYFGQCPKRGGCYVNTARILKAPGHTTPPLEDHGQTTKSRLIKDKRIIILLKNFSYLDSVSINI